MRSQHEEKQQKEKDVLGEKVHMRNLGLPARREVSSSRPSATQQKFGGLGGMKWSMEDTVMKCRKWEGAMWSSKGVRRWREEQPERLKVIDRVSPWGISCEEGLWGGWAEPGERASGTRHSASEEEAGPCFPPHLSEEQPGCSASPVCRDGPLLCGPSTSPQHVGCAPLAPHYGQQFSAAFQMQTWDL